MKSPIAQNALQNKKTLNHKGDSIMNNLTSQIGNITIYSNDPLYLPFQREQLNKIDFSHLPVGAELPIYDSITDNHFTLQGKRISLKKEYKTRVVIGCVECLEYLVAEDEDLQILSCEEFVEDFISLINSKLSRANRIAA